jgi:hypothetical protein
VQLRGICIDESRKGLRQCTSPDKVHLPKWPTRYLVVHLASLTRDETHLERLRSPLTYADFPNDHSRYILTVQGKGYRCIAEVETIKPCAVLAVLPFENLESSQDQDGFADGLTKEAIVAFGQIDPERLIVIERTSSMVYRRAKKAIR